MAMIQRDGWSGEDGRRHPLLEAYLLTALCAEREPVLGHSALRLVSRLFYE